jgi:rhamnosyltransferase
MIESGVARPGVCAIVVSYHPDSFCDRCLRQIIAQADHTVIVDNGSAGESLERVRALASERASVVLNGRNLGIAAALNIGIRHAHELGFSLLLLLDHDTELLPDAIRHLVAVREAYGQATGRLPGIVGGAYVERRDDNSAAAPICAEAPPEWTDPLVVITSGSLIDWRTYSECGPFREDFFIDQIDHEYCLRLHLHGLAVIRTRRPIALHRIGSITEVASILSLGRRRAVTNHSPIRRYYQARNLVLLKRLHGQRFPQFIRQQFKELRSQLRHVVKYENQRWAKLGAAIAGLIDGWRGISGPRRG